MLSTSNTKAGDFGPCIPSLLYGFRNHPVSQNHFDMVEQPASKTLTLFTPGSYFFYDQCNVTNSIDLLFNRTPKPYVAYLSIYCSKEHKYHMLHLYQYTVQQNTNIICSNPINILFKKTHLSYVLPLSIYCSKENKYNIWLLYTYTVQQNTNIICSISINILFNDIAKPCVASLSISCSTETISYVASISINCSKEQH